MNRKNNKTEGSVCRAKLLGTNGRCRHTEEWGSEGTEVSRRSRSVPSAQTPSPPTEYKSSRVSAWATLMCCVITAGLGKECVLTQERCLLNTAVGKLLRNHPQSRRSSQRCSLQQFRFAPATTPWLPIMFFSPRNEIRWFLPIHNNFIRAFTYSELCCCVFWAEGGPVCQAGQADTQAPWLGRAAAWPGVSPLSWSKSLSTPVSSLLEGSLECFCLSWHG